MEPISMIVGALALGAAKALKGTANEAVQDSYKGLKTAVIHHWKKHAGGDENKLAQEANILIESFENDPDIFLAPLEKKISTMIPKPTPELIEKAQDLHKILDEEGFNAGKYNINVNHSQGVQVGDNNTQTNNF